MMLRSVAGRAITLLMAGLLWVGTAGADGKDVLWAVSGKHNRVYLLGSIHLRSSTDRALPKAAEAAYQDAENIIEELDLFATPGELASPAVQALQALPSGQTLADVLEPALLERLHQALAAVNLDAGMVARVQPWYAALIVLQTRLAAAGFDSADGVDYQIAMRAQHDHKPLRGLETALDQLRIFAGMSMDEQRKFLSTTLDETDIAQQLTRLTDVWRSGDLAALERELRSGADESPAFFKALTTDRNLLWLPQIEAMLADGKDDYLVVTGALHMVGSDGLVELLRRKGYKVVRK